jgi:hypothetical protein
MIRLIIIGAVLLLIIHLLESFFNNKKIMKVNPTKLKRLKQIFASDDSAMLISRAINKTIELEQWRAERARIAKNERESS